MTGILGSTVSTWGASGSSIQLNFSSDNFHIYGQWQSEPISRAISVLDATAVDGVRRERWERWERRRHRSLLTANASDSSSQVRPSMEVMTEQGFALWKHHSTGPEVVCTLSLDPSASSFGCMPFQRRREPGLARSGVWGLGGPSHGSMS